MALFTPSAATSTSYAPKSAAVSAENSVRKRDVDAEVRGASREDLQQRTTRDTAEAVPARRDRHALHVDVDVVPVREVIDDGLVRLGISGAEVLHRLVGEHHAQPNVSSAALRSTSMTSCAEFASS
jgi:hypothetical protein